MAPLLGIQWTYGLVVFLLSLYSLNHGILAVVFWRLRRRHPDVTPPGALDAPVTIQIPIYNEIFVAERVIRSACDVDYPRHLLEIQVLDDSTDETVDLTRRLVAEYQAEGVSITHVHRTDRRGFKSGALANGLAQARGEFLAVFDADFVVPPDFLHRTIPHFGDPRVGFVQTRWSYYNETASELTRATALALDGHFVVEQSARSWAGWFLNFNGTAGVLRRAAIVDAGGWQDDTLTEDLDLSYRLQLAGWRPVFLPHVTCPSEIPEDVHSLKVQQFRWTKGPIETARKLLPRLWRADLPLLVKWQGTMHLLGATAYPLIVLMTLLTPAMVLAAAHRPSRMIWPLSLYFFVATLGTLICYASAACWRGGAWWARLVRYPLFLALSIGISAHNTLAVLEALRGKRSSFERTPKYRATIDGPAVRAARYRSRVSWSLALDVVLAVCSATALTLAIQLGQYGAVPFLTLCTGGYCVVSLYALSHLRQRRAGTIVIRTATPEAELASAELVS